MRLYPKHDSCDVCGLPGLHHTHEDDREGREEQLWEERNGK